jgi:hypothetical protein
MFRCMRSGCPWTCGTRRTHSCAEGILTRGLSSALWLVLLGSILAGMLSMA